MATNRDHTGNHLTSVALAAATTLLATGLMAAILTHSAPESLMIVTALAFTILLATVLVGMLMLAGAGVRGLRRERG